MFFLELNFIKFKKIIYILKIWKNLKILIIFKN